jgi:hypothetical protein
MPQPDGRLRTGALIGIIVITAFCLFCQMILGGAKVDEVAYLDPGVNWVLGNGFISSVNSPSWSHREPFTAWGSSSPGMSLLYAGWFYVFGFGLLQSKLLSFILFLTGICLLSQWVAKRFVLSLQVQLIFFATLLLLPSSLCIGLSCRPDILSFLFFVWFLSLFFLDKKENPRFISAIFFGAVTFLFGLQITAFFALASLILFVFWPNKSRFFHGIAIAAGTLIGVLLLYIFYSRLGVWDDFILSRKWHHDNNHMPWAWHGWRLYTSARDLLFISLALLCLVAILAYKKTFTKSVLRVQLTYALLCILTIPFVISSIGLYYQAYTWMVFIPVLVIMVKPFKYYFFTNSQKAYIGIICLFIFTFFNNVSSIIKSFSLHSNQKIIASYLDEKANKDDIVCSPWPFYYYLKPTFKKLLFDYSPAAIKGNVPQVRWRVLSREYAEPFMAKNSVQWVEVKLPQHTKPDSDDMVLLRRND